MSNKIKEYYDNLKLTQKEFNNNYIVDGIEYPKNIKTHHQEFELFSDNHINYMTKLFNLFEVVHNWLEDNNIPYTIYCGNLLGYYRQNYPILWDDDFDILLINDKGIEFINNIWNNNQEIAQPIWDEYWMYKTIIINEKKYFLLKMNFKKNWFKLLYFEDDLNNLKKYKDLGGIDITYIVNGKDGWEQNVSYIEAHMSKSNMNNSSIVQYGPVIARVLDKEPSIKYLLDTYGTQYINRNHPYLNKKTV
jgi:hypothetical protein